MMSDDKNAFLDLTTDCFGDNVEMQLGAREVMSRQLVDESDAFEKANDHLKKPAFGPSGLRLILLILIVFLGAVFVVLLGKRFFQYYEIEKDFEVNAKWPDDRYEDWKPYFGELSEQDKLLLFGNSDAEDPAEKMKGLWLANPDDSAAYMEYILNKWQIDGEYPEDMLTVAKKIDPDNALYYFLEAATLTENSVKVVGSPPSSSKPSCVIIKDPEKFAQVSVLLQQAIEVPEYDLYRGEMAKRRAPFLNYEGLDSTTAYFPMAFIMSKYTYATYLRKLSDYVRAEAYRCEQERDVEGFKKVLQLWKIVYRRYYTSSESLMDIIVLHLSLMVTCLDLADAANACGLLNVEKRQLDLQLDLQRIASLSYGSSPMAASKLWRKKVDEKGSAGSSDIFLSLDPELIEANGVSLLISEPERFSEHAAWNRVASAGIWLLMLIVALITWIYRSCSNPLTKKLSNRMQGVLGWRDGVIILCVGVFLPIAYYWLVNGARLPVSVQNWNVMYRKVSLPGGQSLCLLLLLILLPMLVTHYRLKKYVPFKEGEKMFPLWISAAVAAIMMPVFGLLPLWSGENHNIVKLAYCVLAAGTMLMFFAPVLSHITRQRNGQFGILQHVRHHVLIPIYVVASLAMAMQIPICHSIEKHWVAKNSLNKLDLKNGKLITWYERILVTEALNKLGEALDRSEAE